ncbi:protein phosphatase 1 regulatory inhibitor subunit 16B [Apiospora sp. TS-2023a]
MSSPSSAPLKCGRPPNESYINLMKPDEDWRTMEDVTERRKIQNRLAQRAYRRSLRDKNMEVQKLKKQLMKFQKANGGDNNNNNTNPGSSRSSSSNYYSPSPPPSHTSSSDNSNVMEKPEDDMENRIHTSSSPRHSESGSSNNTVDIDMESGPPAPSSWMDKYFSMEIHEPLELGPALLPRFDIPTVSEFPNFETGNMTSATQSKSIIAHSGQNMLSQSEPLLGKQSGSQIAPATRPATLLQSSSSTINNKNNNKQEIVPDANASLLHLAVAGGHLETVRLIVKHKHYLMHERDSKGYTPVQLAILAGLTDIVALFLENGGKLIELNYYEVFSNTRSSVPRDKM